MHGISCSCPRCRGATTHEFEFGTFAPGEPHPLSEQEELELAMELLSVQSEEELDQFLGKMFRGIGRGLRAVGKRVLPVLGRALKTVAKTALPLAGGALGTLIPIPGVGTALGRAIGSAAANALETEFAGYEGEDAEIEKARRFVRLTASAIGQAANALDTAPPEVVARTALTAAARRHIPGIDLSAIQPGVEEIGVPVPRVGAAFPAAAVRAGQWRRVGGTIVIDGV